jgi:hypothetical protein
VQFIVLLILGICTIKRLFFTLLQYQSSKDKKEELQKYPSNWSLKNRPKAAYTLVCYFFKSSFASLSSFTTSTIVLPSCLLIKLNVHRTTAQPGRPHTKKKPPKAIIPQISVTHSCRPHFTIMNAPPVRLETTVQIKPTAHSCGERGSLIMMTTVATKQMANVTATAAP